MLVRQLDHVFPVITVGFAILVVDDDRAIGAVRFLKAGMRMEPVGAVLKDREAVGESLARLDAGIRDARHAVLIEGQNQPVPVDRCIFVEIVRHIDDDIFTFLETKDSRGLRVVVADPLLCEVSCVDGNPVDGKVVFARRSRCR